MKITPTNYCDVLDNLKEAFHGATKAEMKTLCNSVNAMLDELRDDDFFGTEGQNDPRGDHRN